MSFDELNVFIILPTTQIALIMGIAEVAKRLGLPSRFIPLLDLALGLVSGVCVFTLFQGQPVLIGVMTGIALGLSACGLFSGIKNVVKGKDNNE